MNCVNCNIMIVDIDSVRYAPDDAVGEYPMCEDCAPDFWGSEINYWDSIDVDSWSEYEE